MHRKFIGLLLLLLLSWYGGLVVITLLALNLASSVFTVFVGVVVTAAITIIIYTLLKNIE